MLIRGSKSEKANAARKVIADTQTQPPIIPDKIQRDISDDVNLANATSKEQNKKQKTKD